MTTAVVPFAYSGQQVRVVTDEDGRLAFVVTDVAALLGYRAAPEAARMLREHQRGYAVVSTPGGPQRMITCTEAGLNRLVLRSRASNADEIQDWVTDEVLPAIRRTGSYGAAALPDLRDEGQLLAYLEAGALAARQLVAARREIDALAPRAYVADTLLEADGDQSVADTAKELASRAGIDIGARRLFDLLEDLGWIYKERGDGRWHAYQRAVARGLVAVKPQTRVHPDTGERVVAAPQVRVTPKGLERLLAQLKPSTALAVAS